MGVNKTKSVLWARSNRVKVPWLTLEDQCLLSLWMLVRLCSHPNVWLKGSCRGYFPSSLLWLNTLARSNLREGGLTFTHCLKSTSHRAKKRKHGLRHVQQLVTRHLLSESSERTGRQMGLSNLKACPQWLSSSSKTHLLMIQQCSKAVPIKNNQRSRSMGLQWTVHI